MQSESIDQLAKALSAAQKEIRAALKDSENPFFKSNYADLSSVWDACREPLTANNLCVMQPTEITDNGETVLVTTLAHASGQWMQGRLLVKPVKNDPQGMGSALTYARRYALAAMVGIVQTDDDAEDAMNRGKGEKAKVKPPPAPQRNAPAPPPPPTEQKGNTEAGDRTPGAKISGEQLNELFSAAKTSGWTQPQIMAFIREQFRKPPSQLTADEYQLALTAFGKGAPA